MQYKIVYSFSFICLISALNVARGQNLYGMIKTEKGFWMDQTEITNNEYRQFLKDLEEEQKEMMLPDTSVWDQLQGFTDPMKKYYFEHPAYDNYPVVGVSFEQAVAFCSWRTEAYNAEHEQKLKFNLPTQKEWEDAAFCNFIGEDVLQFAGCWGSAYDFSRKKKTLSKFNFNFRQKDFGMEFIDGAIFTSAVDQYPSDVNGFNDLCGNVAEMTQTRGLALGGSWFHGSEYGTKGKYLNYDEPTPWLGFRCIAKFEQ